ncbi:MAG: hypothetical protein ABI968_10845 [Acidobacteriota bacterium]
MTVAMAWVTCPQCGFTQISAAACLKCRKPLSRPPPRAEPAPPGVPVQAPGSALTARYGIGLAALAMALAVGGVLWGTRARPAPPPPPSAAPIPAPWTLDLTGRWQGKTTTTIAGSPSRLALREAFVETDRSGNIVAAGVTLTDPGHGGAGAGYLTVPDGQRRIREIAAAILATPAGASMGLDFMPLPAWVPQRDRKWRAVEGLHKTAEETTYLLLESLETDYLVQAGINSSGFLSYLFLSPGYTTEHGKDALSKVIHPGSENSLQGFHNLVWDLSGAADFVRLQVNASLSKPVGSADPLILRR